MSPLLAQLTEAEICGEGLDTSWICQLVFRSTENEVLSQAAAGIATAIRIVLILIVAYLVGRLLRRLVTRFSAVMEERIEERLTRARERGAITETQRYRTRRLQRLQAITGVLRGAIAAAVWLAALFAILYELDVRLQPILAGAGLIGVVVGFGAQQLVRDVIAGIAMLIEDQYGVGDWIEVDGVFGEVERVGLRSTAFRDLDGVVHHVLNGYIQRVGNLSQRWARATLDVPIALDADVPAVKAILHKVAADLADDPVWGPDIIGKPEIWGVQEFGPQGLAIRLVIATKPLRNWDIKRQLRERINFAFDRANIRMPSQLVEIGGQRIGYAVMTRDLAEEPGRDLRRHDVADDTAPADRPADHERVVHQQLAADDHPTVVDPTPSGEIDLPDRDHTDQLRLDRGPQPRPD